MKKIGLLLLLTSLMIFAAGCSGSKDSEGDKETLTLSVAASLTDCMEELEKAFKEEQPAISLQFNFGSSGALQQQIEQGAPVDIFFSAGVKQMNALEQEGLLVSGSREDALKNRLALIVPASSNKKLTFKNLAASDIKRLAVGEVESVPVGQYTMEVLDNLGEIQALMGRFIYAKDVREVLSWVETGNVDAGVVYETDAKISPKVKISDISDDSLHSPIVYPVGIVKSTQHLESSQLFISFLKTEKAAAIFEEFGFTPIFK